MTRQAPKVTEVLRELLDASEDLWSTPMNRQTSEQMTRMSAALDRARLVLAGLEYAAEPLSSFRKCLVCPPGNPHPHCHYDHGMNTPR